MHRVSSYCSHTTTDTANVLFSLIFIQMLMLLFEIVLTRVIVDTKYSSRIDEGYIIFP